MGEILGIGLSHYPPLAGVDADMSHPLRTTLRDEAIPPGARDAATWPELMREEWGADQGEAAAAVHRSALVDAFLHVRAVLDDFSPDALVIIGDDQYENFREDIIPPYAVLAYGDLVCRPWDDAQHSSTMRGRRNVWDEPGDTEFAVRGVPDLGRALATGLLERDVDVAYAYRPHHHPNLSHAFINALLFLDYERRGLDIPVVPITVNCYGRAVVSRRGYIAKFSDSCPPDPPSPSPRRLMTLGRELASVLSERDERVAIIASSSWSHAFLCDKTWRLRPDTPSDRALYQLMLDGGYGEMSDTPLETLEDAGQHEVLNWFVLFGAMAALGRTPSWSTFVETDVFNSNKVFALYADDE